MDASHIIGHETYTGSTSVDGYPTEPTYGNVVERTVYGWQPETFDTTTDDEHTKRVSDRIEILVPATEPYAPLDRVTLGSERYLVDQIRDYTTGPFAYWPGGVVVAQRWAG